MSGGHGDEEGRIELKKKSTKQNGKPRGQTQIPRYGFPNDRDFRVILDLGPASKGHALILPKTHAANIYELSDELAAKAMVLAKKMAGKMTEALNCDGFNIVQNNGEVAGQTVFHFHMHLIPRYKGDGVGLTWTPGELTDEVRKEILSKINAQVLYWDGDKYE